MRCDLDGWLGEQWLRHGAVRCLGTHEFYLEADEPKASRTRNLRMFRAINVFAFIDVHRLDSQSVDYRLHPGLHSKNVTMSPWTISRHFVPLGSWRIMLKYWRRT